MVTLDADLPCSGEIECNADILRAVKIEDGKVWGFYTFVESPCVRLQFFDDGRTAMNHKIDVCADPTVASNIGAQCCGKVDSESVCPGEIDADGQTLEFEYERHTGNPFSGDMCRRLPLNGSPASKCPTGCKKTNPSGAPHCVLESDDTNSVPCHLDIGGVVSSGGGECLYVAEPMEFGAYIKNYNITAAFLLFIF